jgi:hypothetical protein
MLHKISIYDVPKDGSASIAAPLWTPLNHEQLTELKKKHHALSDKNGDYMSHRIRLSFQFIRIYRKWLLCEH